MTGERTADEALRDRLRAVVGRVHVLHGPAAKRFETGFRFGQGRAVAVARPGTLVEMWRVLGLCVESGATVIVQAANTGLTGGSTPFGDYDRPVAIISTERLNALHLIRGGEQVVCSAGVTLYDLERRLSAIEREPHSVIGSSCIGASVVGGVCNNSGGALIQRGPAYTEYAIYARIGEDGQLRLHNHLGIRLGAEPEAVLARIEAGDFTSSDIEHDDRAASSARDYDLIVRAVEASTPARFNADPGRLFEASGSAGKVVVFAVRLDTFPKPAASKVFYVGTNDPGELSALRRTVLTQCARLPISAEYIHRDAFDLADAYGKDTVIAIRRLGTDRLPLLYALKARIDRMATQLGMARANVADRLLQACAAFMPDHLPARMRAFRDRYEHHLIIKIEAASGDIEAILRNGFPGPNGDLFECTAKEAEAAMLHRFAVAGAAVRYRAIHPDLVEDIVALDIALPRDTLEWVETLPEELSGVALARLYYGHFFCHVLHQDYIVKKGRSAADLEHALLELMDRRGAEYPAEHNVGHLYRAKPALAEHYRRLDPCNALNPGIGMTSRQPHWR